MIWHLQLYVNDLMPLNRINNLSPATGSTVRRNRSSNRLIVAERNIASSAVERRAIRLQTAELRQQSGSAVPNPFDITIELLLGILLSFSALAFGATEAWSSEVTLSLCGLAVLVLCLKLAVDRSVKVIWSWTYLPMGLFVLLVALQCITLPARCIQFFSPEAVTLRSRLLGVAVQRATFSLYPSATLHHLQLPVCAIAVFVVVLNVYQRREQIVRLLATIATVAGAVILLAAYQNLSGSRMIYGLVPAIHLNSGPFMNYGHYAQFTNISLGAAIGLILFRFERLLAKRELDFARLKVIMSQRENWIIWLLVSEVVLGAVTVFLSMSRMGTVSLIAAGAITAVTVSARSRARGRGTLLFILAIVTFAGLLCAGADSIFDRLATFRHLEVAQGGRWEILRDLRAVWGTYPLLGTGLGTHEFVFPMFDRSTLPVLHTFAENEYAQLMEETGALGVCILLLFLAMLLWKLGTLVWNPVHRLNFVAYGLLFAIAATLIHSFSDFGQHVPAIAFLTAVECALIVALSRMEPRVGPPTNSNAIGLLVPRWAAVLVTALALLFSVSNADRARAAEAHDDSVLVAEDAESRAGTKLDLNAEISTLDEASQAATLEPTNVSYALHRANHAWEVIAERSQNANTQQLTLTTASVEEVGKIVWDLRNARQACPTFGPLYSFAGQLEMYVLQDPSAEGDIQKGFSLAPYEPSIAFLAGQLEANHKNWDAALVRMHRAVDLNDSFRGRVVDTLAVQDQRPDLAMTFATGRRDMLNHLADVLSTDHHFHDLCQQLRLQSFNLLKLDCRNPDAPPSTLMELADDDETEKKYSDAIELYRRALDRDYAQVDWRLKLAGALAKTDKTADAIHEARVCLQLRPAFKPAEDLIVELSSVRRAGVIDQ